MYQLTEAERQAIEGCGWSIIEAGEQDGMPFVDIENWSPLGEDLLETVWIKSGETLAEAVRRVADYFDVDEHVAALVPMRGEHGVPSSISALVKDAEEIADMLDKLAEAVEGVEEETEEEVTDDAV